MSKNADYNRMIQSKRWKVLRKKKIESSPICEECNGKGIIESATEVHHIIPVETASSVTGMEYLMFDMDNLRSLCHKCHRDAHIRLASKKKENIQKNNQRITERFRKRFFS